MDRFPVKWNIAVIPILSIVLNIELLKTGTNSEFHHIWTICHSVGIPAIVLIILNSCIYKKLKVLTNEGGRQSLTVFAKAKLKAKISIYISVIFIFASVFYCFPVFYWVS